jgi:hypothetical protein
MPGSKKEMAMIRKKCPSIGNSCFLAVLSIYLFKRGPLYFIEFEKLQNL